MAPHWCQSFLAATRLRSPSQLVKTIIGQSTSQLVIFTTMFDVHIATVLRYWVSLLILRVSLLFSHNYID